MLLNAIGLCLLTTIGAQGGTTPPPTLERASGLVTASFTVPEGTLRVYLPDDLSAGDTITGSVVPEPNGATPDERERNQAILEGYVLESPDAPVQAKGPQRQWTLPKMAQIIGFTLHLKSPSGKEMGSTTCRVDPPRRARPSAFDLPKLGVVGRPYEIRGPFDGDMANTSVRISGAPIPPLAESPGKAVCFTPGLLGKGRIECREGDRTASEQVQLVTFSLTIADAVIKTGETTTANVRVGGLADMGTEPLRCLLISQNPEIVGMEGGDVVPLTISPQEVGSDGSFRKQVRVTAHGVGKYTIALRSAEATSPPIAVSPSIPANEEGIDPEELPAPFAVRLGKLPPKLTGSRPQALTVEALSASSPIEVATFAVRRLPNGPWETVGTDSDAGDGFSVSWDRADFAGGTYAIRAEASGGNGETASDEATVTMEDPSGIPSGKIEFNNRNFQNAFNRAATVLVTVLDGDIRRKRDRANGLRGQARGKRDEANEHEKKAQDEWDKAESERRAARVLEALDEKLARKIGEIGPEIAELAKRIAELKAGLPAQGDPAAIDQAVKDLEKATADCDKDCEKKKQDVADLEKKIADLEKEMQDIADEVGKLFAADGWKGKATFDKAAGTVRWGYVRDGGTDCKLTDYSSPESQRLNELRKQKNAKKKDLKKAKEDLERAKDALADCEKECAKKKQALEDAKKAKDNKDEAAAKEAKIDEKVAELDAILAEIEAYLARHPELKDLSDELKKLRGEEPIDAAKWEDFLKRLRDFMTRKAQKEDDLRKSAAGHDATGEGERKKADDLRGEASGLDDQARQEDNSANDLEAKKRREEAEAAAAAKKAEEERNKAAAAAHRDCLEMFKKWIQDNIDAGILPADALEKLQNWLNDQSSKIPDLIDVAGKVAGGATKAKPGAGAAGLAEGIFSLGAAIFYWWAEAELKGACDRLAKKIDEVTKQRIAAEMLGEPKKPCGILHPMRDQSQSWFYFRKGNKLLLFKISRRGGFECMGEIPG